MSKIIRNIKCTCPAMPVQYEGTLMDGRMLYFKYRHGWLSISVSKYPTTDVMNAVSGCEIYGLDIGDQFDGDMPEYMVLYHLMQANFEFDSAFFIKKYDHSTIQSLMDIIIEQQNKKHTINMHPLVEVVERSIEKAIARQSNLSEVALSVGALASPNIRHFLNNLGMFSTRSLEIGTHIGGTLVSTLYGNNLDATAIDNFSEMKEAGDVRGQLAANIEKTGISVKFIENDCFIIPFEDLPKNVDLYFYDGWHDYECQKKAITHFKDIMANTFIFVVDDASWQEVKRGTYDGIKEAGLNILYEQSLYSGEQGDCGDKGWWNGLLVFVLQKQIV